MKTHASNENSVLLAFAELDRLERARADFSGAKQAARERLSRQAADIHELRARFEAERPRAWARVRRANEERRRLLARAAAEAAAAAEVEHRERLARHHNELAAKRLRLAALTSAPTVERPTRRVLEWSVPAAATLLVAFLGFSLLGEEMAEAAEPALVVELDELEVAPELEPVIPYMEPAAKPKASKPKVSKPKTSKPKASKPKASKPKASKPKASKPKGHSNPLILTDFNGNPLG